MNEPMLGDAPVIEEEDCIFSTPDVASHECSTEVEDGPLPEVEVEVPQEIPQGLPETGVDTLTVAFLGLALFGSGLAATVFSKLTQWAEKAEPGRLPEVPEPELEPKTEVQWIGENGLVWNFVEEDDQ